MTRVRSIFFSFFLCIINGEREREHMERSRDFYREKNVPRVSTVSRIFRRKSFSEIADRVIQFFLSTNTEQGFNHAVRIASVNIKG